jgi:nickel-dependent lactate racemase
VSEGTPLAWGRETLTLRDWPYRLERPVAGPAEAPASALADPAEAARLAAGSLRRAAGGGRLAVAVPDRTRPARSRAPLLPLLEALRSGGFPLERVDLLVARGLHGGEAPGDLAGSPVPPSLHDALAEDLVEAGSTRAGAVLLNALWVRASARLSLGSASFHYLAGFGGGRKTVVPGLAGWRTIVACHAVALTAAGERRAGVEPGRLEGNPFHEGLEAAAGLVPPDLALECIDTGRGPRWLLGDWRAVHREGADWVRRSKTLRVSEARALVVASVGGHPRDRDLIQSHKALEHLRPALRPGGTAVLLASCEDGLGHADFSAHLRLADAAAVARALSRRFVVYGQTAWALKEKAESHRLVLVSRLPREEVAAAGLLPAGSLEEALSLVREGVAEGEAGWLLPDAGSYRAAPAR